MIWELKVFTYGRGSWCIYGWACLRWNAPILICPCFRVDAFYRYTLLYYGQQCFVNGAFKLVRIFLLSPRLFKIVSKNSDKPSISQLSVTRVTLHLLKQLFPYWRGTRSEAKRCHDSMSYAFSMYCHEFQPRRCPL